MKEIFSVKLTLANKISYYHLLAFLIALPFDRFYSELVLASFLIHAAIQLTNPGKIRVYAALFLPALLYMLTVFGTFYSSDVSQAYMDCEKQLGLLLFPLIFCVIPLNFEKYKIPLLKAFGLTCALLILYLFFDAWHVIQYNKLPFSTILTPAFTNHNFSSPVELHATYFSMYISLSLAAYLYLLIYSKKRKERIFYSIICLILFSGLLQLASRSVFLATLLIINVSIPFFLLKGKMRKKFIFISACFSLIVIGLLATSRSLRTRYLTTLRQDLTLAGVPQNLSESRMRRWHYMGELIRQRPILGYGSGTEVDLLKNNYFEHRLYNSFLHELNADNEYISLFLKNGIVGLLVYVFVLFLGFKYAIRYKDFFFFSFLLIISVVSISENILDVNKGIFFFSFFFTFFMKVISDQQLPSGPVAGIKPAG